MMTDKLRAAAETTVEALINASDALRDGDDAGCRWILYEQIHALRQALADTGTRQTMTASELADRIKRGEKWALAEPATFESSADALRNTPLRQALAEPDTGTDRGAWHDVPDATKWVDDLRGEEWTPDDMAHRPGGLSMDDLPPKREWIGLTYTDLQEINDSMRTLNSYDITDVYAAIEAKLREKNHAS